MSADLAKHMPMVARALLGDPNKRLTMGDDWRYGRKGSLSVNVTRGLFQSFETGDRGGVLELIRVCSNLEGRDAFDWMRSIGCDLPGPDNDDREVGDSKSPEPAAPANPFRTGRTDTGDKDRADRRRLALKIWDTSKPAEDSPVSLYLRGGRAIDVDLIPDCLRFHPRLKYEAGRYYSAMVAAVQDAAGEVVAVHRTFLEEDRSGVFLKADVETPKKALGSVAGGAVRLAEAWGETLCLTEGIEDALALFELTGCPTWAVIGTAGFCNVVLPDVVKRVVLCPDPDEAGEKVIVPAAKWFASQGRDVMHLRPPAGMDWCDALEERNERAAFWQYEGGIPRSAAEKAADLEVLGWRAGNGP